MTGRSRGPLASTFVVKRKYWMAAKVAFEIIFGIGYVLIPVLLGSAFGLGLDATGALMARLFGTAFIFGAIVLWLARNVPSTTRRSGPSRM